MSEMEKNVGPSRVTEQEEADRRREMRIALEREHGQVWNTDELKAEFQVDGFMAPYVAVTRRSDGKKGGLEFTHSPRFYFAWKED